MKKYKAVIVEDEKNNSDLLSHFLKKYCLNIDLLGAAEDINEAKKLIEEVAPEIVFLDIKLNQENSFDLLDIIDYSNFEIIFITAYEEFALKAFKYNAIDYILKPISINDLILAVNKAILRVEEKNNFENLLESNTKKSANKSSKIITVTSLEKIDIINKSDIIYCKSDGRYTTFFLSNNTQIVACKNLGEYETILNDEFFFRVHHSYIVNISYIKQIFKKNGVYCEMKNNTMIPVSKRRQESLNKFLKE